jgi:hypothetical protein
MFPLFSRRSAAPTGQGHWHVLVPETALASARRFEGTLAARAHRAWTGMVSGILGLVSPTSACRFRVGRSVLYAQKRRTYIGPRRCGHRSRRWRMVLDQPAGP